MSALTDIEGIGSKTRRQILAEDPEPLIRSSAYRFIVPRETMLQSPETAALMLKPLRIAFFGPGCNVICYPISRGKYFNVVMEREYVGGATLGVWNKPADLETVHKDFEDFAPIVHRIVEKATACVDWTLARLPALSSWSSESGRVLLIGDAAHATTPHMAQGR